MIEVDTGASDPLQDLGFFGPGSVAWSMTRDSSMLAGAFYAALIFELYPPCAILTDNVGSLYRDPVGRARRSLDYLYTVVYGDTQSAYDAAAPVRRMHQTMKADWPMTGATYSPADPENLLWLHMTNAEGMVRANRAYAENPIHDADVDRFWAEFVPFAELQGVPREMVPASAEAAAAYFDEMRPKYALTAAGRRALDQILYTRLNVRGSWLLARLVRSYAEGAVVLLDERDRELIGFGAPQATAPAIRAAFHGFVSATRRVPGFPTQMTLLSERARRTVERAAEIERAWEHAGRPVYAPHRVDLDDPRAGAKPTVRRAPRAKRATASAQ